MEGQNPTIECKVPELSQAQLYFVMSKIKRLRVKPLGLGCHGVVVCWIHKIPNFFLVVNSHLAESLIDANPYEQLSCRHLTFGGLIAKMLYLCKS